jgi:hypothetical protein
MRMTRRSIKWLVIALVFGGCNFQQIVKLVPDAWVFWYADRNLEWIAFRYVNHYVELTSEQKAIYEPKVEKLANQLKYNELTKIRETLEELKKAVERGLTVSDLDYAERAYEGLRERVVSHVSSDAVNLVMSLNKAQLEHFRAKLIESNDELTAALRLSEPSKFDKKANRYHERFVDKVEYWTGALSKEQTALVKHSFPVTREDMTKLLKMREEVHATLYDIVVSKDREKMEAQFIRWGNNPAANRSEEYRQYATERTDNTKKFVLELDGTLTEGQRARVLKKMQTVIDGLSRLSRRDP